MIRWTSLAEADIEQVQEIADQIHPTLPERSEVFAEKFRLFPQGCYKLMFGGRVAGYAVSHPWKLFSIPPLDEFLHALPEKPDCIYMHDVAVLPEARGHNAAGQFIDQISSLARQMEVGHLACVSVYGTDVLWARFGFQVIASDEVAPKLATYGASAKYMIADIASGT